MFFPLSDNLADDMEEHTSGSWLRFKKHYTIKSRASLQSVWQRHNRSSVREDTFKKKKKKSPLQSLLRSSCYYFHTPVR